MSRQHNRDTEAIASSLALRRQSRRALNHVFLDDALAHFRELFPLVEVTVLHMEHQVRSVCQLYGGFEPKLLPVLNTADSLLSMVAAGRGVFLRPEIALRGRTLAVSYHVLPETKRGYEIYSLEERIPTK